MQNGEFIASTLEATCDVEVDIVAELCALSSRERLPGVGAGECPMPRGVSSDLPKECRYSVIRIKDIVFFRRSERVKSATTAPNVAVDLGLRTRKLVTVNPANLCCDVCHLKHRCAHQCPN